MRKPEFMDALLSDQLTLAQRKQFGSSSEKYADSYTQMNLFNEGEQEANPNAAEPEMEEIYLQPYRRKTTGKKEEELSSFGKTEVIEHKLEGEDRFCPDCGTKYKVVATEKVKYLKFVPARFEAVEEIMYVYSFSKCGMMKRPQKKLALLNGLKPYDYLNYLLERLKDLNPFPSKEELLPLLPWSESIPENCRTKTLKNIST